MVNEEIVNSTIKRMLDAEIDEETIISTLKDIGMSAEVAKEQIGKIRNSVQAPSQDQEPLQNPISQNSNDSQNTDSNSQEDSEDQSNSNSSDDDSVGYSSDDVGDDSDAKELGEITNQNEKDFRENITPKTIVKQREKIDLKLSGQAFEQLSDLKAQNNAVLKIMKDVLEVNRKILTELESKK
jgi:hypothetical protein